MQLTVNGASRQLSEHSTLLDLLDEMGVDPRYLVVEYNGEALGRTAFASLVLQDADRLELVRPVAGG